MCTNRTDGWTEKGHSYNPLSDLRRGGGGGEVGGGGGVGGGVGGGGV